MDNPDTPIEVDLRAALRRGRELPVAGFSEMAVAAVHRDVRRRRLVRWASVAAPLAACAAALLLHLGAPSAVQAVSEREYAQLVSLHEEIVVTTPRLDDAEALAAIVLADLEDAALTPRLEGGEESIARIVLGS